MFAPFAKTLPHPLELIFRGGWTSVQTFFVLSGLVLARTYNTTPWNSRNLRKYFLARFARVYPGYLLSLIVVSPFIYTTLVTGSGKDWAPGHKAFLLFNYLFVLQGWTGDLHVGWNTPAWSLSCEFIFYLCFPLLALTVGIRTLRSNLVLLAAALLLPTLLATLGVPDTWKPIHHLADFFTGIAAAAILDRLTLKSGSWLYIPAILSFLAIIAYPTVVERLCVLNTALRPVNALLLLGFALGGGWLARILSTPVAGFLGQASYAMYILHIPLLWWCKRYDLPGYFGLDNTPAAIIFMLCVVGIASLAFHFVEEPANKTLRGLL